MHITCIFENKNSTLCETKNYKSGEFWGNSGEIRRKYFYLFTLVFPGAKIQFPHFGYSKNRWETLVQKREREFTWKREFPSIHYTSTPYKFQLHSRLLYRRMGWIGMISAFECVCSGAYYFLPIFSKGFMYTHEVSYGSIFEKKATTAFFYTGNYNCTFLFTTEMGWIRISMIWLPQDWSLWPQQGVNRYKRVN